MKALTTGAMLISPRRPWVAGLIIVLCALVASCGDSGGSNQAPGARSGIASKGDPHGGLSETGLHPSPTGRVTTVARGRIHGITWRLLAYDSDHGLCVNLSVGSNSLGGCGREARGHLRVASQGWSEELPGFAQIHGAVSKAVTTLALHGPDRRDRVVRLLPSAAHSRTFFVLFVPLNEETTLSARDRTGRLLDRQQISASDVKAGLFESNSLRMRAGDYDPPGWVSRNSEANRNTGDN